MTVRVYLDGRHFDGETIRVMGVALETAWRRSARPEAATTRFAGRSPIASSHLPKRASATLSVYARMP
jgi:hypothetical protein